MENLFSNLLHLFVVFMMVIFVVGGILALTGSFDHWTERYRLKQRRRRLIRNNAKNNNLNTSSVKRNGKPVEIRKEKPVNTFKKPGYAQ